MAPEELESMLAGNLPSEQGAPPHIDNDFHQYFIERSQSRCIQDFFAAYGAYYTALFDYAAFGASVIEDMARRHREILTHVPARRGDMPRCLRACLIRLGRRRLGRGGFSARFRSSTR